MNFISVSLHQKHNNMVSGFSVQVSKFRGSGFRVLGSAFLAAGFSLLAAGQ